jgi:hypothetical protein
MGLDEVLTVRIGPYRRQHFSTQIIDVRRASWFSSLVGVICRIHGLAGRASDGLPGRHRVRYGTLDLSGPYRRVFEVMVRGATLVADPFHVTKLANAKFDGCCRRVQNETLGHYAGNRRQEACSS